jgi:hypothetical protein
VLGVVGDAVVQFEEPRAERAERVFRSSGWMSSITHPAL